MTSTTENPAIDITSLLGESKQQSDDIDNEEDSKPVNKTYTNSSRFRPRFNPPKGCIGLDNGVSASCS